MVTNKEDCIKINSQNVLNKSIRITNKGETFYLKDNKLYRENGLFGLSFIGYNEVKQLKLIEEQRKTNDLLTKIYNPE